MRGQERVRVRGLLWDVLESDQTGEGGRLLLRCAEGDLAGLEWEAFSPPETIEPAAAALDPTRPGLLSAWTLKHRAHILTEMTGDAHPGAGMPGRLTVEPYQYVALNRALDMPRVRLLLADGVGLGKTIQAGLIAAELLARRHAHRILIVTPSGPLLTQWEREMRLRFGLRFATLTSGAELRARRRGLDRGANPFEQTALCLTSHDFAKQEFVLEELEQARWDLVIIDEAHHVMRSPGEAPTHRRRLAEVLAERSDALLLLTATPHDGDDARFASLIALLDPALVNGPALMDGEGTLIGDQYRRHVIRRLKSHIRDPRTGRPLFRRRHVIPVRVDAAGPEHEAARAFHRALTGFVLKRVRDRGQDGDALSFVSLLKRSVSTIAACLATLRVVSDRLARRASGEGESRQAQGERRRAARVLRGRAVRFGTLSAAAEASLDALDIEGMAASLAVPLAASLSVLLAPTSNPELAGLIALGEAALSADPKLAALVLEARLIRLAHPRANILVYTEYADSQAAAARALGGLDGEILTIGGQDSGEARLAAADRFGDRDGIILISTDALSEGLNLQQCCFHLIHLDLPYNPNRLEQRNGRVDRHGQIREPEIRYLYLPGTFEESLLLRLIAKYERARAALDVMPDTLGVTADRDDPGGPLIAGMSEEPEDLFKDQINAARVLDSHMAEGDPEQVAVLLREIDRAYDGFERMAVSHGWWAGPREGDGAIAVPDQSGDLADFVTAAILAETGSPSPGDAISPGGIMSPGEVTFPGDTISIPPDWAHGLETLPGFDAESGTFRFTRDPHVWRDAAGRGLGYLGMAHPLTRRALLSVRRLPPVAAAARGDRLALLLTWEMEIAAAHRPVFRRVIALRLEPGQAPVETGDIPLSPSPSAHPDPWSCFACWADLTAAGTAALAVMAREAAGFESRFLAGRAVGRTRWRRWLAARANGLCGAAAPGMADLFGAADAAPVWRRGGEAAARLLAFATDLAVPPAQRRAAEEALDRAREAGREERLMPFVWRPVGLLMIVTNE